MRANPAAAPAARRPHRRLVALAAAAWLLAASSVGAAPQKADGGIRFTYADASAQAVFWAGEFNSWSPTATPMTRDANGLWSAVVPLPPGTHEYKFVVDGQWFADPENPVTAGDFGNSVVVVSPEGDLVAAAATSNTPYSPQIMIGGRIIGLFQDTHSDEDGRFALRRPNLDIDLGFDIRISDVLKAHWLMNINSEKEDVQDFRSRLNFDRGSLLFTKPKLQILAYDNEAAGTWDDPLHLLGDVGIFHHAYGYQRQGFKLSSQYGGFDTEFHYADNFNAGGTTYPAFIVGDPTNPRFVFESDPVRKSIDLLKTERDGGGYRLVGDQLSKVSSMDRSDANADMFAFRSSRQVLDGVSVGGLFRNDRGFNLGQLVLSKVTGDSTLQILSGRYEQEWLGGGGQVSWTPTTGVRLFAEYLRGTLRMTLLSDATTTDWKLSAIGALAPGTATALGGVTANGDHRTLDDSARLKAGGSWSFAQGDIVLRADVEHQTHSYAAWTQPPTEPAGLPPTDDIIFENAEYQRKNYVDAGRTIDNAMTITRVGWERNWRHYLEREVRTGLHVEVTHFEYDPRTNWQYQLWFPTGNFWLETGEHVVTTDRLTMLGERNVIRVKPSLAVPLLASRAMILEYLGTLSGVTLGRQPKYAESILQFGFDLSRDLRFNTDTRWAKYDDPELSLAKGYVSHFFELEYRFAPTARVAFSWGVDPWVIDPLTNEYAYIGRDVYLIDRNANGFFAETNYLSLAPMIAASEKNLRNERRLQVEAIVRF